MTGQEFCNEFDILYNSICSNEAPGLDVYEKSVLLTEAQEELIKECYSGQSSSFEINEAIRRSLDSLVKFVNLTPSEEVSPIKGTVYTLPEKLWLITYESVKLVDPQSCRNNSELMVVPTTHDEYNRIRRNPFRGPGKTHALRLDIGPSKVSIVSIYPVGSYTVGYISKPPPIILKDLESPWEIDGESRASDCILNSYTHRYILERAVRKAAAIYKTNQGS